MKEKNIKTFFPFFASFFCAFTLFGYGARELYLTNIKELWFQYNVIRPYVLGYGFITFIILGIVLYFLRLKRAMNIDILVCLISIMFFVQAFFLPNDYGSLDGVEIVWNSYIVRLIYNSLIWILVCGGGYFYAKNKNNRIFITGVCITILLIQVGMLIFYNCSIPKKENNCYLSVDNKFNISKKENTIVIILDRFDANIMLDIFEKYPEEVSAEFRDFTFYRNTVGGASSTVYAIPYIFTGKTNTGNQSYEEYINNSYGSSDIMAALEDNYSAEIYTHSEYVDVEQNESLDNIVFESVDTSSAKGLTDSFLKIVGFKYAPHVFKRFFWIYSGEIDSWKSEKAELGIDSSFYKDLVNDGLTCSIEEDVFRCYHLRGAHPPYTMNEFCQEIESSDESSQALGALRIAEEYINQLKCLNKFDDSTIIVMADHGGTGELHQNPLFMVKDKNIKKEFSINTEPFSYANFSKYLAAVLRGDNTSVAEYTDLSPRKFYRVSQVGNNLNIVEWETSKEAWKEKEFYKTGNVYKGDSSNKVDYSYSLGEDIWFTDIATGNKYTISGFSANEGILTWATGYVSELLFEIDTNKLKNQNLLLEYEYAQGAIGQEILLYVNDNMVADYITDAVTSKRLAIPNEYIVDGIVRLRFEFPDATVNRSYGEYRKLGLGFTKMCLSSTKQAADTNRQIMQNTILADVDVNACYNKLNSDSVSIIKSFEDNKEVMALNCKLPSAESYDDNIRLILTYKNYENKKEGIDLYVGDEFVGKRYIHNSDKISYVIPRSLINSSMELKLVIDTSDIDITNMQFLTTKATYRTD